MLRFPALLLLSVIAYADDLPRGQIVDSVACSADATEHYALYLPSNYSPERRWSVILAFDAGGRGRTPVVQFQEAAEKYGYIVAGSLNSRNGPLSVSVAAANAMWKDVSTRFSVDKSRLYMTGQSGGARAAMYLAMYRNAFGDAPAGVIASSAGFPDPSDAPESLPFPVFATAGTEDFNHLEMRQFDRSLKSRHRLAIFEGGHMWLPAPLAMTAVEWMEIDAMKTGLRAKDSALIDGIFVLRLQQARARPDAAARYVALAELASDFTGLKNVKDSIAEAGRLGKDPSVKAEFEKENAIDAREEQLSGTLFQLAAQLGNPPRRAKSFAELKTRIDALGAAATAPLNSPERQMSRRVLRGLMASSRDVQDADFQTLMTNLRSSIGRF